MMVKCGAVSDELITLISEILGAQYFWYEGKRPG